MSSIRKQMIRWSPDVLWALVFSMAYTLFVYLIDTQIYTDGTQQAVAFYYARGWLLAIPLVLCNLAAKKLKHILQFVLFGLVLFVAVHFMVECICFTILTILFWFIRLVDRATYQAKLNESVAATPCMFDDPSLVLAWFAVGCFLIAGMTYQVFAQQVAVFHFVAILLVLFVYNGLLRFEEYVRLNETSANVPSRRILETGTRIFLVSMVLVALIVMPVIKTQYQFVPVSTSVLELITGEGTADLGMTSETSGESEEREMMMAEDEVLIDLSGVSKWVEWMVVIVSCALFGWLLLQFILGVIKNFNLVQIEKDDVIESTFDKEESIAKTIRRKQKMMELFDFSENMKIRRRYKKELKKSKPKPWQSPAEIEASAKKVIPELHEQYENVRYGTAALAKSEQKQ